MILDAYDLPDGTALSARICIVGAGAAGIAMALEFIGSGVEVVVLEAGGHADEKKTQALYEGSVTDAALHSPLDRYRQRRFGGSTTIWGGRCMPFDAIDFEQRDYMPHSGWPIDIGALKDYYPKANRLCEAGEFAYSIESAFDTPRQPMIEGFDSPNFTSNTLERFSCPTNFAARYQHKLRTADNVRVLLHANVTHVQLNTAGNTVKKLTVRTLTGKTLAVEAEQFVLCSGGLEVARLLLASRDVQQNGVGNEHDVVGRYYMCHIAGTIGTLQIERPDTKVWHSYDVSDEGIYCRRRMALVADAQHRERVGNFIARLHHPRITDPAHRTGILSLLFLAKLFIPYEYGKRLHGEEKADLKTWLQHLRNVITDPFYTLAFLWHWLRDRTLPERKFPSVIIRSRANRYSLDFHAEQQPNADSRVTLSSECDELGMPRLIADWRYTRLDVDTVTRSLALLAADIKRSGIGSFSYDPATIELEMTRYGAYGGHHIGTTRMGTDPRDSVVNSDCRVHSVDNLYIASAATFPTSSQANPTLTVVAMALRLAAHLRSRLGVNTEQPISSGDDSVRTAPATSIRVSKKKRKVVVLGANGFIGRHLVAALAACEWAEPVAAVRRQPAAEISTVKTIQLDATQEAALRATLVDADAVVNCVTGSGATIVESARALCNAASGSRPLRIIHMSTMAVYGSASGRVDESTALQGDLGEYSAAKVEAERLALNHPNTVILRPGIVYGPGSARWSVLVGKLLLQRRLGDLGVAGDGICNLLFVDDLVTAILNALQIDGIEGRAYNLAMAAPPTWNAYFSSFARHLGAVPLRRVTRRRLQIETRLLAIPLKVAEIAMAATRVQLPMIPPPIPPSLAGVCSQEILLDVGRAESELGLSWTLLHAGLERTVAWLNKRR